MTYYWITGLLDYKTGPRTLYWSRCVNLSWSLVSFVLNWMGHFFLLSIHWPSQTPRNHPGYQQGTSPAPELYAHSSGGTRRNKHDTN